MDDRHFGGRVRAVRLRLAWRQCDVAAKAGLSRSTVQRIERGQLDSMALSHVRAVLRALDMDLELVPRWRGGELDRIADEGHAAIVGLVADILENDGWTVVTEVSFSVYGERGSIDLLAWHPGTRTLLVVEVKTSLNSVEETLRRMDVKVRLAPRIARERFGWDPISIGSMLALPDDATSRRRVARHDPVLRRAFPIRGRDGRAWLRSPTGSAHLLLFLSDALGAGRIRRIAPRRRVRRRTSQPAGI
ncbi:MAG TPA: helix-turn-helix domain-containing protein [Candidatus Limnocylindrales bacterium]